MSRRKRVPAPEPLPPRVRPEWEYPEGLRKRRAAYRHEIKDQLRRARNSIWYARSLESEGDTACKSYVAWVELHRDCVLRALEMRRALRKTNF